MIESRGGFSDAYKSDPCLISIPNGFSIGVRTWWIMSLMELSVQEILQQSPHHICYFLNKIFSYKPNYSLNQDFKSFWLLLLKEDGYSHRSHHHRTSNSMDHQQSAVSSRRAIYRRTGNRNGRNHPFHVRYLNADKRRGMESSRKDGSGKHCGENIRSQRIQR